MFTALALTPLAVVLVLALLAWTIPAIDRRQASHSVQAAAWDLNVWADTYMAVHGTTTRAGAVAVLRSIRPGTSEFQARCLVASFMNATTLPVRNSDGTVDWVSTMLPLVGA